MTDKKPRARNQIIPFFGVPDVTQQIGGILGALGFRFDPWHSGVRVWHCYSCSVVCSCGSDLMPGLEIPHAVGRPKKKENTYILFILELIPELNLLWVCETLKLLTSEIQNLNLF